MEKFENFLSRVTIFHILSATWIVGCLLFVVIAVGYPAGVLMVMSLVLLAFCLIVGYLSYVRHRVTLAIGTLNIFLDLIFGQSAERFKSNLSDDERLSLAERVVEIIRLVAIGGGLIGIAFLLLAVLNMEPMEKYEFVAPLDPIPTSTMVVAATATPTAIVAIVTPVQMATVAVIESHLESEEGEIALPRPTIPPFTVRITNTIPMTASMLPHERLIEEYGGLVNLLLPKLLIAEVSVSRTSGYGLIVIANHQGRAIDLSGWSLSLQDQEVLYFQDVIIDARTALNVHIGVGKNDEANVYWPVKFDAIPQNVMFSLRDQDNSTIDKWEVQAISLGWENSSANIVETNTIVSDTIETE